MPAAACFMHVFIYVLKHPPFWQVLVPSWGIIVTMVLYPAGAQTQTCVTLSHLWYHPTPAYKIIIFYHDTWGDESDLNGVKIDLRCSDITYFSHNPVTVVTLSKVTLTFCVRQQDSIKWSIIGVFGHLGTLRSRKQIWHEMNSLYKWPTKNMKKCDNRKKLFVNSIFFKFYNVCPSFNSNNQCSISKFS